MKSKKIEIKETNRYGLLEVLLKYCALFLFSFLFLVEFSNNHDQESDLNKEYVHLLSDGSTNISNHPIHFPLGTDPNPEIPEENYLEEGLDNDWNIWTSSSVFCESVRYHIQKTSFFNLISSFRNRTTVSLYILHHSWKSFLY